MINKKYNEWVENATEDADLVQELESINNKNEEIQDRFYRELVFGTGGLRGELGVGTNRMNIYTVGKATQGYSNYLNQNFNHPSVAIAYDSRNKSNMFARVAACVFAANNIKVNLYKELMPTPALSFAVRDLECDGGVVVTASHNPAKYNGYKVYGSDGCQITLESARAILAQIDMIDVFTDVKKSDFDEGVSKGTITYISEQTIDHYLECVSKEALQVNEIDKDLSIVYTPLNGAGRRCVTTCLKRNGFTNICIPKEQEMPDGNFLTCPYPNPEIREALEVGLKKAQTVGSDLLLATDPDCDRVGVAVRANSGYELISGNQMGVLLMDYICKIRKSKNILPEKPIVVSTIVSTKMADKIAEDYQVEIVRVLTGFKFIGEQIGLLEMKGEADRFIFGFEESYGYLSGSFVRDKDGVNASLLICEMFAYYKGQGKSLLDVLDNLYAKYGYFTEELQSITLGGISGNEKMNKIMGILRDEMPKQIIDKAVISKCDYKQSVKYLGNGSQENVQLPKSDVVEFNLENDITAIVRPSGTEPKLKIYYSVKSSTKEQGNVIIGLLKAHFSGIVENA